MKASPMKARAWLAYLLAGVVATLVFLFVPGMRIGGLLNLIALSSPVVILVALRLNRVEYKLPWVLIALGQVFFVTGDVITYNYQRFFMTELPFPSIGDVFYLSVYPCLFLGIFLLIRRRSPGRDRDSAIDSLIVGIGVGVLSWVFLIAPYTHDSSLTLMQKLVSIGYPLMDLMLVTGAIRLAVGGGRKNQAFYFLLAAVIALFVTDAIYGWFGLHGGYDNQTGYLEGGWAAFYLLFGAAALHPGVRLFSERSSEARTRLSRTRLVVLAVVSLTAPVTDAVIVGRYASGDQRADQWVVITASVILFLLVIARMSGLVRQQEKSAGRERALREAGVALVTATNQEAIHVAAIEAARALAGVDAVVRLCEETGEGTDGFVVVAGDGGGEDVIGRRFSLNVLQEWKRQRLLERDAYVVRSYETTLRDPLGLPNDEEGSVLVAPLFIRDQLRGMMVVATLEEMPVSAADSLRALSSQVALALESAALTEDLLLRQSEARFASLVKNSSDVVAVIEPNTVLRYASPSASRVLGFDPAELEGTRFIDLVHADDKTRALSFLTSSGDGEGNTGLMEFRMRHRDGSYLSTETLRTSLLDDQNVKGIVLNTRDITERKQFEEQLQHQAFHDPITHLANRALFRDRVLHAIERQERDKKPIAVLFMDIDDFKTVNDSLGHAAGDGLLKEVGDRLKKALRSADTAARLGGDEFAILLEDGGEGIRAAEVAERIMQMLEDPFALEGKEVFIRASVGIAVADGTGDGGENAAETLMRNADVAMYMAKERGKGRYQVFEPEMHDTALRRLELKADLQRALDHDEFILHYQPVIELESGAITGVEALIRWIHPERGIVQPLEFIPLAEETGLIVPIGRWVLGEACRFAVELQTEFPSDPAEPPFHMAVNLSARQLARPEIVDEVRDILADTGLSAPALILEITESMVMQDMELAIERLNQLKQLGVLLAIDDFGTGYSSLNYVRRFPVDILKVDKSFIDEVADGGESSALTAAVIELAGILNLKPVAEGIERADQLERLMELKCDMGQGYLFARPLDPRALRTLLQERSTMHAEADALAHGQ
ncbi:MAG: putative bifunctional diguanylate cyclase/phosphodiesterase [Actinomycetota bacterium]